MTVYLDKARGLWRYDFWHAGKRHVGDCMAADGQPASSRTAALKAQEAIKVAVRNRPGANVKAPTGYFIGQAMADWRDTIRGTANEENAKHHIREFLTRPEFAPDRLVTDLTLRDFETYIAWAKQQVLQVWIGGPDRKRAAKLPHHRKWRATEPPRLRSASTINHYLSTIRAVLLRCTRLRDPVTQQPILPMMPEIPKLRTVKRLPRPVPDAGLKVALTNAPPHLIRAALLCRLMGFRKAEVLAMVASRMDDQHQGYWLPGDETKGKRDEFVPANPQAWELLCRLRNEAKAAHHDRLILYYPRGKDAKPRPVKNVKRSWNTALKAAGLEGQHTFHNLKASFVTAIGAVSSGPTTQGLARHKNFETTKRYLEVIDAEKRKAVETMQAPALVVGAPELPSPTSQSHIARKRAKLKAVK